MSGDLLDEGGRTRLRCDLEIRLTVIAFMAFWFIFALIGGGRIAIPAIGFLLRGDAPTDAWRAIGWAAIMPAVASRL